MKNIALIFSFQQNSLFARNIVRGVLSYKSTNQLPWQLNLVEQTSFDQKLFVRQKYDGVIGILPPHDVLENIPFIHITGQRVEHPPGSFCIEQDNEAIIRVAVDHLWRKGYRNLALFGYPRLATLRWQEERIEAFLRICAEYGATSNLLFPAGRTEQAEKKNPFLQKALKSTSLPLGIIATNDFRALDILETANRLEIRVPEQIGVTGIDNDEMLCSISTPTLTSIDHFPEKKGYHAAHMLNALLCGEKEVPSFSPSPRVIERDSTDALVHGNEQLRAALEHIRRDAGTMLRTEDVARGVDASRTTIERMFRTELHSSVNREITAVRISMAKQKLSKPEVSLKEIAEQCGFQNVHYFTTVFKKSTGVSPGAYRKTARKDQA